jgi:hypothetical protein
MTETSQSDQGRPFRRNDETLALEWEKLRLEKEKLEKEKEDFELRSKQFGLENSFPKKWGTVLFGSLATVVVAMITAAISWHSSESQDQHKKIENTRTALEVYFANRESLRPEDPNALSHMQMIAEIADNEGIRRVFEEMQDRTISGRQKQDPDQTITDIVAGLPSLKVTTADRDYKPSDFAAYIQYPNIPGEPIYEEAAQKVRTALETIGMRVPGIEAVHPSTTPKDNEIRFYRTLQKVRMSKLPTELREATGLSFEILVLNRSNLPDGIIEVWIGHPTE